MGELKPPLQRLAALLDIQGDPIRDYGWTDVCEAVHNLVEAERAIRKVVEEAADRTCAAYDHAQGGPCPSKPKVQGVCAQHAVMCSMCGKGLSARGICPGCLKVLAVESREATPREPAPVLLHAPTVDKPAAVDLTVNPSTPKRVSGVVEADGF